MSMTHECCVLVQAHNGEAEEFYRNLVGGLQKPVDAAPVASTPSAPTGPSRAGPRQAADLLLWRDCTHSRAQALCHQQL